MDIAGSPDLLVSGINDGANVGTFTQVSGTVGAATVALSSSFNGSIPAIAISTDPVCEEDTPECQAANEAHFATVANFVADLQLTGGVNPEACRPHAEFRHAHRPLPAYRDTARQTQ